MKNNEKNKVVIITGASSGIGLATAEMLFDNGYIVYGLSRTITTAKFYQMECDVTKIEQIEKCFDEIYKKEGRINYLLNNAGIGISGAVEHIPYQETKLLFDVNLLGVFNVSKVAIKYMRMGGGGMIINTSSIASIIPIPFQSAYSSSKAGINNFTMALRLELEPYNIKVCAIMPGDTKTGFTKSRIKIENEDGYNKRISSSISKMEKDEKNGVSPKFVAKVMLKTMKKSNPKPLIAVGFSYKIICVLEKILPKRLMLFIVKKLYAK